MDQRFWTTPVLATCVASCSASIRSSWELALAVVEINSGDGIAGAVNHFLLAMRAVGALRRVAGHVASANVVRPFRVGNGLGVAIVSTPKGVMADHSARENNVGGEVLCTVF